MKACFLQAINPLPVAALANMKNNTFPGNKSWPTSILHVWGRKENTRDNSRQTGDMSHSLAVSYFIFFSVSL